jgi:energy-coupling factor transporter ATP-binding protein EcfA2
LRENIEKLTRKLDLGSYGKISLAGEHKAWRVVEDACDLTISNLRQSLAAGYVDELDVTEKLRKALKTEKIQAGTKRFNEVQKRAKEALLFVNETVSLQSESQAWRGLVPPTIGGVPSSTPHERLLTLIVSPLVESSTPPDPSVLVELAAKTAEADDIEGLVWLARVIEPILNTNTHDLTLEWESFGDGGSLLFRVHQRRQHLRSQIVELNLAFNSDDETDLAQLYLSDDDLDAAALEISRLNDEVQTRRRDDRDRHDLNELSGVASRFRDRIKSDTELSEDQGLLDLLRLTEEAIVEERVADARTAVHQLRQLEAELTRSRNLDIFEKLVEDLEALDSSSPALSDFRSQVGGFRAGEVSVQSLTEAIELIKDRLAQTQEQQADRLAKVRENLEERLVGVEVTSEDQLVIDQARQELDTYLAEQNLPDARRSSENLIHLVERLVAKPWSALEGEEILIEHLVRFISNDTDFSRDDILRLYVALKTKPFVVLAGLTGSGKSTIARLTAEALGATTTNGRFVRVAVRPDWVDQSDSLGYVNPVSNRFEPGWLSKVLRACQLEPNRIHVALLDEMNLAPVEQYMADALSAMEELRAGSNVVEVPLYFGAGPINEAEWPATLPWPPNLFILGTVNIDETTRTLSDRVLDRANLIQLSMATNRRHHRDKMPQPVQPLQVPFLEWNHLCRTEPSDRHHDFLEEIAAVLAGMRIGVGIRSHVELERFLANSEDVIDDVAALDLGLLQRVIPKIRGFKRDLVDLAELHEQFEEVGASRCASVLAAWLDPSISDDEYLDGTDPKIGLLL